MKKLLILAFALVVIPSQVAVADHSFELTRPVSGSLLRAFEDVDTYAAGHRGVDLAADPHQQVLAAAQGRVHFAGMVAGRPTVSVDHGNGWRTTYQPVRPTVTETEFVTAGQPIGTVVGGHCATWCLHWGLTDGTSYADPMLYLLRPEVRLVPHGTQPSPTVHIDRASTSATFTGVPVHGPISSPFGMRLHPVRQIWKLHDGIDFAVPCGSPIYSPAPGVVTQTGYAGAYGYRVLVDHGNGLTTSYSHLPSIEIALGARLAAGERIGSVGTTGLSTGCHLHWTAAHDGTPFDPMSAFG